MNQDESPVAGTFYGPELQRVEKDLETEEFLIEKILKYKTTGGKKMALVSWMGYDQVNRDFYLFRISISLKKAFIRKRSH